jgi:hypothetical protein
MNLQDLTLKERQAVRFCAVVRAYDAPYEDLNRQRNRGANRSNNSGLRLNIPEIHEAQILHELTLGLISLEEIVSRFDQSPPKGPLNISNFINRYGYAVNVVVNP